MKIQKKFLITIFLLVAFIIKANSIEIPTQYYNIDYGKKVILTNYNVNTINQDNPIITEIVFDKIYKFTATQYKIEIGNPYNIIDLSSNETYTLYFTELPMVSINTDFTIQDTPKVLADFRLIETDKNEISTYIGIEYRGASSQAYPKKSLEIEFWTNQDGSSTTDIPILGMMNDDSFNLQAMYNEDTRIRSKTANELWLQMNSLSYQDEEPNAKNGIRSHYVEVFMNNEYYGIYALGEKVNRKNLKLKKHDGSIKGELYKGDHWAGAPTMYSYDANYNNNSDYWSYFEYKHPKQEINWGNLHNFISFVVDSDQETFLQGIDSKFEINNAIDYFIFMNIIRAVDNTGKNLYIAKYDKNRKYFYVPWDLDATFGYNWDGSLLNEYTGLLTNGMYEKLLNDDSDNSFKNTLAKKWFMLRENALDINNIYTLLQSNNDVLLKNNVYIREGIAWDYNYNNNAQDYMKDWLLNRITYLDGIFSNFLSTENTVNKNADIKYFPNPVKNELNINLPKKDKMSVQIYTASGKLAHTESTSEKDNKINLSKLTNGTYFVNCKTKKITKQFKIIVSK